MLKNHFKTAWRSISRNKTYSILNILGLSAGLTCFALIAMWVDDELSFDKFNSNYRQIFRLTSIRKTGEGVVGSAVSSAPMAAALKADYPEVEETVRLNMRNDALLEHKGVQVLEQYILLTDPSFFDVFSFGLSKGNPATALREPYSIVLTESTAKKYFGDSDPTGKSLTIYMNDRGNGASYKITGVMPDPPSNSHFMFSMLASFKTVEAANPGLLTADGWSNTRFYTYVLLKNGADYKTLSKKMSRFYEKYAGDLKDWKPIHSYQLQPLGDIHLRSNLQREIAVNGSITQVRLFATIGVFILLLAGINYTNLATARSAGRAKEVGIKKVAGANKGQLILQYLAESVFIALAALVVSFVLTYLTQPFFSEVTDKNLSLFSSPALLLFLLIVTVVFGLISGIYPAVILSGFKPAMTLKGSFKSGDKGIRLRKTLVVFQFVITMILITGILIIYAQMSFIKHKDLGYNKEALLFIRLNGNTDVINGFKAFKNELQSSPLIYSIATSNSMIAGGLSSGSAQTVDVKGNPMLINTAQLRVDTGYLNVYGMNLLAGKNFSTMVPGDSIRQIIINEKAVKNCGWENAEAAIGKPFKVDGQSGTVTGVIADFHFNSLDYAIEPLAIYPLDQSFSRITVKVDTRNTAGVQAFLKNTWKKHFPSALLDYDFVDHQIKEQYRSEERFSTIFLYFSVLSLIIACLGLYGLISFTIFQKTKEIGIRKVLGATAAGIATMLSGSFLKLVMLAFLVATPVAWYFMNSWLEDFAYRTNISWWMFASAGLIVMLIALLTISFQAIKAAVANPVTSLRTE